MPSSPSRPPKRAQPNPEQAAAILNAAAASTRYLLLGFLVSWLPMPWTALALLPLLYSLIYNVRHLMALRSADAPAAARTSSLAGIGLTTLLVALVAIPCVSYAQNLDYQKCLWGANTREAQHSCDTEFSQNSSSWQNSLLN